MIGMIPFSFNHLPRPGVLYRDHFGEMLLVDKMTISDCTEKAATFEKIPDLGAQGKQIRLSNNGRDWHKP